MGQWYLFIEKSIGKFRKNIDTVKMQRCILRLTFFISYVTNIQNLPLANPIILDRFLYIAQQTISKVFWLRCGCTWVDWSKMARFQDGLCGTARFAALTWVSLRVTRWIKWNSRKESWFWIFLFFERTYVRNACNNKSVCSCQYYDCERRSLCIWICLYNLFAIR